MQFGQLMDGCCSECGCPKNLEGFEWYKEKHAVVEAIPEKMSERIPVAQPMKSKKKRVKHFGVPGTGTDTRSTHWTRCGVRKVEGDIIEYVKNLRTSVETNKIIGHHRNWTEDPKEVTCKRCRKLM